MAYVDVDKAVGIGYLSDWYQSSIDDTKPPIWTDEHIEELTNDFIVIPKDTPTSDFVEVKHGAWTPVKEELPRIGREYLCICVFDESERQYYNVLRFHPEKNAENGYVTGPHFSNEGMNGMRVTHWMPLPKPPRGAE